MSSSIIPPKVEDKPRELPPSGNQIARCYGVIHVGSEQGEYQGSPITKNVVYVTWELPGSIIEFEKDGEKQSFPMSISKEYTLSFGDKANLKKDVESWRGEELTAEEKDSFDIAKLAGAPCILNILHKTSKKGRKYAIVTSVTPLMQGQQAPKQVNDNIIFGYNPFEKEVFDRVPSWLQERIMKTPEYDLATGASSEPPVTDQGAADESSDLPF